MTAAATDSRQSSAWVWQAQLDSRYALRESTEHVASFHVQSAGRSQLQFHLPPGAELARAVVDDVPLAAGLLVAPDGRLAVDLPAGKRFAAIVLQFVTAPGDIPRLYHAVRPAWPEVDVPVLTRRWKLWLPAGIELAESDSRWESAPIDPPTWSQRLFGPFGRSSRQMTFDPLAAAEWRGVLGGNPDAEPAQAVWRQFHAALLGALTAAEQRKSQLTWGELLGQISATLAPDDVAVLVDAAGLSQVGLAPHVPLGPSSAAAGRDPAMNLLQQARAFVLVGPQSVVLTGEAALGDYLGQIAPLGDRQVGRLLPGPLAEGLGPGPHSGATRFEPAMQWMPPASSPWPPARAALGSAWDSRGWNTYTLASQDQSVQGVALVNERAVQSLAWGLFLLVFGLAFWKRAERLPALVLAAALFAALGLLVSPAFVPLAAAGFLAALCGLLLAITDRPAGPDRDSTASHRASRLPTAALPLLLTAMTSLAVGLGAGAAEPQPPGVHAGAAAPDVAAAADGPGTPGDPSPDSNDRVVSVARIFVPVDDAQRPLGSKVYVPQEFYKGLLREAAAASEQPGDWLLTRAAYRAYLVARRRPAQRQRRRAEGDVRLASLPSARRSEVAVGPRLTRAGGRQREA